MTRKRINHEHSVDLANNQQKMFDPVFVFIIVTINLGVTFALNLASQRCRNWLILSLIFAWIREHLLSQGTF